MESELINRTKDSKIMKATNIIDIEVYGQEIIVFYGESMEFEEYMTDRFNISVDIKSGVTAKTLDLHTRHGRKLILFVNEDYVKAFDEQYYTSITHEVYHLVGYVLRFAGIEYSLANDEPGAHITGFLNKRLYLIFETEFEN